MKILGIDPGLAIVGYAFLESDALLECGVLRTAADLSLPERLKIIHKDMQELLTKHKPDIAVVEELFFAKNAKTAISVAHARGVILQSLASNGLKSIIELTPTHVKQVLFGHGQASKKQIQQMVSLRCNLTEIIQPDDAADAVAIALAGREHHRIHS